MKKIFYSLMAVAIIGGGAFFTSCDDDDDPVIKATHPENELVGEYEGTWFYVNTETGDTTSTKAGSMSIALHLDSTQTALTRTAEVTLHCEGETAIDGKTGVVNVTIANNIITYSNSTATTIGTSGHIGSYNTDTKEIKFRFANSVKVGRKYVATRITFDGTRK